MKFKCAKCREEYESETYPCSCPKCYSRAALNTWWQRNCNGRRYFLRQIHDCFGKTYVWIYQEGVNKCLHIPLASLQKNYTQLVTGPVDPETGNVKPQMN